MKIGEQLTSLAGRFNPQELALIQNLEFKARYLVEGYLSGIHRSPFHGLSVEFCDYREYLPGDDPRRLDWRVFARADRLVVREYTAETNTDLYLVLDTSGSMAYRGDTAWASKIECAQVVAGALAWLLLRQNDAVGLLTVDQDADVVACVRPSKRPSQLGLILQALEQLRASGQAELPRLMEYATQVIHRRSLIVFLSDLLEPSETIGPLLSQLRYAGHDCTVVQVLDRDEIEFPFESAAVFEDLESGIRRRVLPQWARTGYRQRFSDFMGCHRTMLEDLEMPLCVVRTDEDPMDALALCIARRKHVT